LASESCGEDGTHIALYAVVGTYSLLSKGSIALKVTRYCPQMWSYSHSPSFNVVNPVGFFRNNTLLPWGLNIPSEKLYSGFYL
jgi:hypothetical protein